MYLRVVRRSLDSVIVYDMFIYMIFDILFVLSYFIYFDRMELSPKIKFTYVLTYLMLVLALMFRSEMHLCYCLFAESLQDTLCLLLEQAEG